ncbi:hypothetical protein E3G68_005034 [Mycobacteroides abscessus]|uniref:hypothetical protein n=1 Tax=Mycobacteroides abscessus TaxID=36809 RepID=UPI001877DFCA|nr:hypothetical protein [Mycobacteroides abscessus]
MRTVESLGVCLFAWSADVYALTGITAAEVGRASPQLPIPGDGGAVHWGFPTAIACC